MANYTTLTQVTTDTVLTTTLWDQIRGNFLALSSTNPAGDGTEHKTLGSGSVIHANPITIGEGLSKLKSVTLDSVDYLAARNNDDVDGDDYDGLLCRKMRINLRTGQTTDPIQIVSTAAADLFRVTENGLLRVDSDLNGGTVAIFNGPAGLTAHVADFQVGGVSRAHVTYEGRLVIASVSGGAPALAVSGPSGLTASLITATRGATQRFAVSKSGNILVDSDDAAGDLIDLQRATVSRFRVTHDGLVRVIPSNTGSAAILANVPLAHAGTVFDLQRNSVSRFAVNYRGHLVSNSDTGTLTDSLMDLQAAGVSRFRIAAGGLLRLDGNLASSTTAIINAPIGQTVDVQKWQVNGTDVAGIGFDGLATVAKLKAQSRTLDFKGAGFAPAAASKTVNIANVAEADIYGLTAAVRRASSGIWYTTGGNFSGDIFCIALYNDDGAGGVDVQITLQDSAGVGINFDTYRLQWWAL